MTETPRLWVRHEVRATERRTPVVPADAHLLIEGGVPVTVENSPQRVFPLSDYVAVGCRIAEPGSWVDAPDDEFIIGLKELPDAPAALRHRHVFFGHAYKGQRGGRQLLRRFTAGGGTLFDLEYLVDGRGHRLAAFGYWAGYVGAALAVLHHQAQLTSPLQPAAKEALDVALARSRQVVPPRVLIIGAFGRCGRGAQAALATAGVTPTCWGLEDTEELDRAALLDQDILVNAVLVTEPARPFLTPADLEGPGRRLTVISDVTCDVTSACNMLPINDRTTTWSRPARRLCDGPPPLDIIAIDNLPALLPREASIAFSADLRPHLASLGSSEPWQRCRRTFHRELARAS